MLLYCFLLFLKSFIVLHVLYSVFFFFSLTHLFTFFDSCKNITQTKQRCFMNVEKGASEWRGCGGKSKSDKIKRSLLKRYKINAYWKEVRKKVERRKKICKNVFSRKFCKKNCLLFPGFSVFKNYLANITVLTFFLFFLVFIEDI